MKFFEDCQVFDIVFLHSFIFISFSDASKIIGYLFKNNLKLLPDRHRHFFFEIHHFTDAGDVFLADMFIPLTKCFFDYQ